MRSISALLFLEVLNPFYIFQLFSFTLWVCDDYVYYALCILAMSICSIVVAVVQTRRVSIIDVKRLKLYISFGNVLTFLSVNFRIK